MTVQEINIRNALKIANTWLSEVQYGAPCFGCGEMEAIKDALEKQIPKNAVVLDKIYDEVRSCPTCGKDTVFHGRTFWCCRCGQLLRWE